MCYTSIFQNPTKPICILIFMFPLVLFSRNLVINSDFETTSGCPNASGKFLLEEEWVSPNIGIPDYLNDCSPTLEYGKEDNFIRVRVNRKNDPTFKSAYYFIDDVPVEPVEDASGCNCNPKKQNLHFQNCRSSSYNSLTGNPIILKKDPSILLIPIYPIHSCTP